MMLGLVLLVVGGLLVASYLALGPIIRKVVSRAAARQEAAPTPTSWPAIIGRHVPAVRPLTDEQRARLLHAMRDLITSCHWEGCGGLALTEEMQLVIAAQACLLTLELPGEPYPNLHSVLIYPGTFRPVGAAACRAWLRMGEAAPQLPELGESWPDGTVVVAWDSALAGGEDPRDGQNVTIHEFAHLIDFQYGLACDELDLTHLLAPRDTPTPEPNIPGGDTWRKVLTESFERQCALIDRGQPTPLRKYAATNKAEFFAVATEAFFEKPAELRAAFPELYDHLRRFFRQDPLRLARSPARAPVP
jgi:Mlc titration factor MtfA (ptsG expression regulator)